MLYCTCSKYNSFLLTVPGGGGPCCLPGGPPGIPGGPPMPGGGPCGLPPPSGASMGQNKDKAKITSV